MEKYLIISSISEFIYCRRRFYLESIEQNFEDNLFTIEGSIEHLKAHSKNIEKRNNIIKVSNMTLFSKSYSLYGKSDIIEFTKNKNGIYIDFLNDYFDIYPIEYKHGTKRNMECYNMQLCAQILCLEEMFNTKITKGSIYYTSSNKHFIVEINNDLREKTIKTIKEMNEIINNQILIKPEYKKRCKNCAMINICNPKKLIINDYLKDLWKGEK